MELRKLCRAWGSLLELGEARWRSEGSVELGELRETCESYEKLGGAPRSFAVSRELGALGSLGSVGALRRAQSFRGVFSIDYAVSVAPRGATEAAPGVKFFLKHFHWGSRASTWGSRDFHLVEVS